MFRYFILFFLVSVSWCASVPWTLVVKGAPPRSMSSAVWGDGAWTLVGASGAIARIVDTNDIQWIGTESIIDLNSIYYNGQDFLAVGDAGLIMGSKDGIQWSYGQLGNTDTLVGVVWNATSKTWNALSSRYCYTLDSTNGWTGHLVSASGGLHSIFWNASQGYNAVGSTGWFHSTNGVHWTQVSSKNFWGVMGNDTSTVVGADSSQYFLHPSDTVNVSGVGFVAGTWNGNSYVFAKRDSIIFYSPVGSRVSSVVQNYVNPVAVSGHNGELLEIHSGNNYSLLGSDQFWHYLQQESKYRFMKTGGSLALIGNASDNSLIGYDATTGSSTDLSRYVNWIWTWADSVFVGKKVGDTIHILHSDLSVSNSVNSTVTSASKIAFCGGQYVLDLVDTLWRSSDLVNWTRQSGNPVAKAEFLGCEGNRFLYRNTYKTSYIDSVSPRLISFNADSLPEYRSYIIWGANSIGSFASADSLSYLNTSLGVLRKQWKDSVWVVDSSLSTKSINTIALQGGLLGWSNFFGITIGSKNSSAKYFGAPFDSLRIVGDKVFSFDNYGVAYTSLSVLMAATPVTSPVAHSPVANPWVHRRGGVAASDYSTISVVTYHDGEFWAMGQGTRYRSRDGKNWTNDWIPFVQWHDLYNHKGHWFGVGSSGWLGCSWTGNDWSSYATYTNEVIRTVAANDSVVVAGGNKLFRRSTDGAIWDYSIKDPNMDVHSLAWGKNLFVAVGWGFGKNIYTSTNGRNWTTLPSIGGDALFHVIFANNQFLAVGLAGEVVTSSNGSLWLRRTSNANRSLVGACWSGTQYVAVGDTGLIITSPDGINWTTRNSGTQHNLWSVTADSVGHLVATGEKNTILYSDDGVNWTRILPEPTQAVTLSDLMDVEWSQTQGFVAVGKDGVLLHFTNPEGPYQDVTIPGESFANVFWDGSQFLATSTYSIYRSNNGINWQLCNMPFGFVERLTYSPELGMHVVIGKTKLMTSTDAGANWTDRTAGLSSTILSETLLGLAWDGSMFVITSGTGTLLVSGDGITWTEWRNVYPTGISDIFYNGNEYLLRATSSHVYRTSDLLDTTSEALIMNPSDLIWEHGRYVWTQESMSGTIGYFDTLSGKSGFSWMNSSESMQGIVANNSQYVVVGTNGTIYTGPLLYFEDPASQIGPYLLSSSSSGSSSSSAGSSSSTGSSSSEGSSSSGVPVFSQKPVLSVLQDVFLNGQRLFYRQDQGTKVRIRIFTLAGRQVMERQFHSPAGNYYQDLPVVESGRYVIVFEGRKRVILHWRVGGGG